MHGAWGAKLTIVLAVATPVAVLVGEKITGRTELAGAGVIFPVLMGTLMFWGMWPVLRRKSDLGTLKFCSAMIAAQTVWVVCCVLTIAPDAAAAALDAVGTDAGTLALIGGASLALGDCGIALTIEKIGIGIGPPIIFTTNIVFGSSLDYAMGTEKSSCRFAFLGVSVLIAVGGILLNSLASARKAESEAPRERAGLLGRAPEADSGGCEGAFTRRRMVELCACVTVGIFSGGWSPLLEAAWDVRRTDDDDDDAVYGLYVIFQCGEFLMMAVLAAVGYFYASSSANRWKPSSAEAWKQTTTAPPTPTLSVFAVPAATGLVIGSGFICYFLTTGAGVASSTSYALGSCCSLVSMAYSYFVFREYDGAPPSVVNAFRGAAGAYVIAIFFLALGGPVFCA